MCTVDNNDVDFVKLKLGDRLMILRKKAIKNGFVELLTTDEILTEIDKRRGNEYEHYK